MRQAYAHHRLGLLRNGACDRDGAERRAAGAAAILLLPHYLTEAPQSGIVQHVIAVCKSVSIGVIVYNRDVCRLTRTASRGLRSLPELHRLQGRAGRYRADGQRAPQARRPACLSRRTADRGSLCGRLRAIGVPVYSSAVFNFIPRTAMDLLHAPLPQATAQTTLRLLDEFFLPYLKIRNRGSPAMRSASSRPARVWSARRGSGSIAADRSQRRRKDRELAALIERLGPQ